MEQGSMCQVATEREQAGRGTERRVLVGAVVRELSSSVMRMPRVRVGDLEGAEVHLYLLKHFTCLCA
jgi:hypothetical protein